MELHTWYPYETSDRCNPTEDSVPVKVFTVRNLRDIRRTDVFRGYFIRNFQGCPMIVNERCLPPRVNEPKTVWNNGCDYQKLFNEGWEIEMLRIIGKALNISLDIADNVSVWDVIIDEQGKGKEKT